MAICGGGETGGPSAGRLRGADGQASVSFLATLPALLILCAVLVQVAAIGWSAWSATSAARAAARAEVIDADIEDAAKAALPAVLADRVSDVSERSTGVEVEIRAPRLLPLLPAVEVGATAGYGAEAGS